MTAGRVAGSGQGSDQRCGGQRAGQRPTGWQAAGRRATNGTAGGGRQRRCRQRRCSGGQKKSRGQRSSERALLVAWRPTGKKTGLVAEKALVRPEQGGDIYIKKIPPENTKLGNMGNIDRKNLLQVYIYYIYWTNATKSLSCKHLWLTNPLGRVLSSWARRLIPPGCPDSTYAIRDRALPSGFLSRRASPHPWLPVG